MISPDPNISSIHTSTLSHLEAVKITEKLFKLDEFIKVMPWIPQGEYLLLEDIPAPTTSEGGIYIPESVRRRANEGIVRKIGPNASVEFQIGDKVLFDQHSEFRINIDGISVIAVLASNVILRLPPQP